MPQSLQGQLLLDGGKLTGAEFHRAVVLICQHDSEGAFGLVLNRASEHTVEDSIVATLPPMVLDLPLFLGGPVQPQGVNFLLQESVDATPTDSHILPGLRLVHDLDELVEPQGGFAAFRQIKFFAGYAGWSPGQLDNEIKMKAWLTHPATMDLVFHSAPSKLWRLILKTKGLQYRLLAEMPDNLSHN